VAAVVSVLSSHIRQRAAIVVRQRSVAEPEAIEEAEVIDPGSVVEVVEPDEPDEPAEPD
jgi:hypothetical protein